MEMNSSQEDLLQTIKRLEQENEFHANIVNAIHDGIIVFDNQLNVDLINPCAKSFLEFYDLPNSLFTSLELFKNKKSTLRLHLKDWLKKVCIHAAHESTETLVWLKLDSDKPLRPLMLACKPIFNQDNQLENVLLIIYDRRLKAITDERQRILDASLNSFDGQFVTNDKGYITHPNFAFSAYTALMPEQLKSMSILNWLQKQVTLKQSEEEVLRTLLLDGRWSGEIQVHPDADTTFHAVLSISMITDAQKNIECYVGTLQDITDIKEAQAEVEFLAFNDELTGLPNRRLLLEHLEHSILHHLRVKTYSAILFLDLDRFKAINDAFGHQTGDDLLKLTAHKLKKILRTDDTVARIGGDEFVILAHFDVCSADKAAHHAQRLSTKIIEAFGEDFIVEGQIIKNTLSTGICIFPQHKNETAEDLIGFADLAMYQAKREGRNRIHFYEQTLSDEMNDRLTLETALDKAHIDEFELLYQPQFDLDEKIVSVETLVRWHHPELGTISPMKFIPIAEDTRQILVIGKEIIAQSFMQVKEWSEKYGLTNISINISPVQFHETNFITQINDIQKLTGVDPTLITLEITEGILIKEMDLALRKMEALTALGYKFSIDDFGTGYSSLSYFQKLPIQELKIDQSFVFRLPKSSEDIAIIETIITLAKSKHLRIVAEGVETVEQAEFFRAKNADILLQGYYFSKPISAKKLVENYFIKQEK